MTKEQIEYAAQEYAEVQYPDANPYNTPYHTTGDSWDDCHDGFIAGAAARQPEIDVLKAALRQATEWLKPADAQPEVDLCVILQYRIGIYLGCYCGDDTWLAPDSPIDISEAPIAWKYINHPHADKFLKEE